MAEPHFGLYFTAQDLPRLLANARSEPLRNWWEGLCERMLPDLQAKLEGCDAEALGDLGGLAEAAEQAAFVWLLSGRDDLAEPIRAAVSSVSAAPAWANLRDGDRPMGDLTTAAITRSMSAASDWAHDLFSPADVADLRAAILAKGVVPCTVMLEGMLNSDRPHAWHGPPGSGYEHVDMANWPRILGTCNWLTVLACGVALGSLVNRGSPEAAHGLPLAEEGARRSLDLYAPDGSYSEGPTYWGMTTRYLLLMLTPLKRSGTCDLFPQAEVLGKSTDFALASHMPWNSEDPNHHTVSIGDAGWRPDGWVFLKLAAEFRLPTAQWAGCLPTARHSIQSVISYDSTITPEQPEWTTRRFDIGWVFSRVGWDPCEFYFAFRSGRGANHEHADRNSFVVTAFGERLIADGGGAYDRRDPSWMLRLSPWHNTVLIDGRGHVYHDGSEGTNASRAEASVIDFQEREEWIAVYSDATEAYASAIPDLEWVRRAAMHVRPHLVLVVDWVRMASRSALVSARFHADNADGQTEIDVSSDDSFVLQRPRAAMDGRVAGSVPIAIDHVAHRFGQSKHPRRYVEVRATAPHQEVLLATLLVARRQEEAAKELKLNIVAAAAVDFSAAGYGQYSVRLAHTSLLAVHDENSLS